MANKPSEFPTFTPLDRVVIKQWMDKFEQFIRAVFPAIGIGKLSDLKINRSTLIDIFDRIEKRRVYFHIYHNNMKMGELNECALLCFWILKLMPFRVENMPNSAINARIAYVIFMRILHYEADKYNPKRKVNIKSKLMDETLYAFRYRDLSKEAIMALAESYIY
jgi:hypothetical protein